MSHCHEASATGPAWHRCLAEDTAAPAAWLLPLVSKRWFTCARSVLAGLRAHVVRNTGVQLTDTSHRRNASEQSLSCLVPVWRTSAAVPDTPAVRSSLPVADVSVVPSLPMWCAGAAPPVVPMALPTRFPPTIADRRRRAVAGLARHVPARHDRRAPSLAAASMYNRHMGTAVVVTPTVALLSHSVVLVLAVVPRQPIAMSDSAASLSSLRWRTARPALPPGDAQSLGLDVRAAAGRARLRHAGRGATAVTLGGGGLAHSSAPGEPPVTTVWGHGNSCRSRDGGNGGTTTASQRAVVWPTTNSLNSAAPVRVLTLCA